MTSKEKDKRIAELEEVIRTLQDKIKEMLADLRK